jgi:hypothetical protein
MPEEQAEKALRIDNQFVPSQFCSEMNGGMV